jgi:glycosyltransferase involved in cell wall biosynthesis
MGSIFVRRAGEEQAERMKKVCMVAYTNYLSDARPRREAEALVSRGDKVDFIALAEKDQPETEIVEGVRLLRVKQYRYRGSSSLKYILSYMSFIYIAATKLMRNFRRERYDIVYLHTMPDLIILVGMIPKLFGATVVLDIHDMMPELYMSKFGISERHLLIRLIALMEQMAIRLADRVICVHQPHLEVLCRRGASRAKITIVPNVPDLRIFGCGKLPVKSTQSKFRIVYHGTIARRLGLDLAVRAFAKVVNDCPDTRLEIYGDGDAAEEVAEQIVVSGVSDKVYFSRKLFRVESVAEMLQGASLGIIPNRRDLATEYMLPVKLLEYVQLGIPVATPRLKAISYYFNEKQVAFYEPGEVDALAEVIRRLYHHADERDALVREAGEFAKVFCWDVIKFNLFAVIDGAKESPEVQAILERA